MAIEENDPSLGDAIEQLYAVISFEEGDDPNWQGLRAIFSPHARITPEGTDYMDRDGFLTMTRNLLDQGAYTSFYEFEIERIVERRGGMAQVWSRYETRRNRNAQAPLARGINSIQLIRDAGAWRVLGLLWDETEAQ